MSDEYLTDYEKQQIEEKQGDERLEQFTPEQQEILKSYIKLAHTLRDKAGSVMHEGREMEEKAGHIDNFIESMLNDGVEYADFQSIENLSGYATDVCHIDLYNWGGAMKMGDTISTFEEKATEWIFGGDDE